MLCDVLHSTTPCLLIFPPPSPLPFVFPSIPSPLALSFSPHPLLYLAPLTLTFSSFPHSLLHFLPFVSLSPPLPSAGRDVFRRLFAFQRSSVLEVCRFSASKWTPKVRATVRTAVAFSHCAGSKWNDLTLMFELWSKADMRLTAMFPQYWVVMGAMRCLEIVYCLFPPSHM